KKDQLLNTNIYYSFYPIQLEGSNLPWSLGFFVSTDIIVQDIKENSVLLGFISILSLLLISLIIWTVLSIIIRPIKKTTEALKSLSLGVISDDIVVKYKSSDELGIMANAVNKLIKTLAHTQEFAHQIGQNNLQVEYKLLSEQDALGKSLIDMRNNLFDSKKEELQRESENKQLNWLQEGIAQLNEILRDNNDNLQVLTYELIKFITKYTKSAQGGFYLLEKDDDKQIIALKSAYAFDRKKEITAVIEIGEGLVGRAVKERRIVNINNLPNGYLQVRSGLGDASPNNLVIIPLMFEENVLGALELAGFSKYDDFYVDFLQQISVRISSSVSVLVKNLETEKLLKESQLQTATFEMKERQFVRSRKRIAEQKKEANIQKQIVDNSFSALRSLGIYIELDTDKTIIDVNDYLLQFFELSKEEIIGKKFEDISTYAKGSKIWIEKFWQDVFNGIVRKKKTIYSFNNKEINVIDNYFLVKDIKMDKILIIGLEN
ncbi:MAG: GAF domain-containing protein, partial [Bacteroidota bacterium]|nr:GAF domain-containing protein [Bacteroidota bacterium]